MKVWKPFDWVQNMSFYSLSVNWAFNFMHAWNNHLPIRTNTQTNTHFQVSVSTINKNRHTLLNIHCPPHPFIESPFSEWLPAVNNKHTDCLEAIKQRLCAFSSQSDYCKSSVPFKAVGVARCIVCCSRVLFKESKSLNIRTKVPQGLED